MRAQVSSHIDEGTDGWRWTTSVLGESVPSFAGPCRLVHTRQTTAARKMRLAPVALDFA